MRGKSSQEQNQENVVLNITNVQNTTYMCKEEEKMLRMIYMSFNLHHSDVTIMKQNRFI